MAKVLIAQSAWQTIVEEVNYFAADGNKEAAIYPMFGFSRTLQCMKAVWEMLDLEDIEYFVITHAHAPIRRFCFHTPISAQFKFANDEEKIEHASDIRQWGNAILKKHPMLEAGNVHSHPFSTIWTQPSSGGTDTDYPRMYGLWQQMNKMFVNTPLEVILTRKFFGKKSWKACCFGFNSTQQVVSLGSAEIVSDDDIRVQRVLAVPFLSTPVGVEWQKKQHQQLSELEAIKPYCFGWSVASIKLSENIIAFMHLSPQFQQDSEFLINVVNSETRQWTQMVRLPLKTETQELSLHDIFNKFSREIGNGK